MKMIEWRSIEAVRYEVKPINLLSILKKTWFYTGCTASNLNCPCSLHNNKQKNFK